MNNRLANLLVPATYACMVWAMAGIAQTTPTTRPMIEPKTVVSKAQATLPPGKAGVLREQSVSWVKASGLPGLRSRILREARLTGDLLDAATLVVLDASLDRLAMDRAELESAYAAWKAADGSLQEYISALKSSKMVLLGGSQTTSLGKVPDTCGKSSPAVTRFFKVPYSVPGACSPSSAQSVGLPQVETELKWVLERIERIHSNEEDVRRRLEDQERQRIAMMEALGQAAAHFSAASKSISLP